MTTSVAGRALPSPRAARRCPSPVPSRRSVRTRSRSPSRRGRSSAAATSAAVETWWPCLAQQDLQELAHRPLVVHHQDARHARSSSAARGRGRPGRRRRQPHREAGPRGPAGRRGDRPPWASTMRWTVASPSPVPPALVVKKGVKSCSRSAAAMPGPSSSTSRRRPAAAGRAGSGRRCSRRPRPPHGLGGVDEEVPEHLPDLVRVAARPPPAPARAVSASPATAGSWAKTSRRLGEERSPGPPARARAAPAGRSARKSGHQLVEPRRLAEHDVHEAPPRRPAPPGPRSSSTQPDMEASGLRSSWARPAATPPRSASRSLRATASSMARSSVRSWKMTAVPERAAARADQREGGVAEEHPLPGRAEVVHLAAAGGRLEGREDPGGRLAADPRPGSARPSARRPG